MHLFQHSGWHHQDQLLGLSRPNQQRPGLLCSRGWSPTHNLAHWLVLRYCEAAFAFRSVSLNTVALGSFWPMFNGITLHARCCPNSWRWWVSRRNPSWLPDSRRFSGPCGPPTETQSVRSTQAPAPWTAKPRYMTARRNMQHCRTKMMIKASLIKAHYRTNNAVVLSQNVKRKCLLLLVGLCI